MFKIIKSFYLWHTTYGAMSRCVPKGAMAYEPVLCLVFFI